MILKINPGQDSLREKKAARQILKGLDTWIARNAIYWEKKRMKMNSFGVMSQNGVSVCMCVCRCMCGCYEHVGLNVPKGPPTWWGCWRGSLVDYFGSQKEWVKNISIKMIVEAMDKIGSPKKKCTGWWLLRNKSASLGNITIWGEGRGGEGNILYDFNAQKERLRNTLVYTHKEDCGSIQWFDPAIWI